MSRQCSSKASWCAARDTPTGDDLKCRCRTAVRSLGLQAGPKIVVLGGRQPAPSTCPPVYIRANSEVGSMDVRVSSVGKDEIRFAKARGNMSRVFVEGVHVDGTGNGFDTFFSQVELIEEPTRRKHAVRIRVGQPAAIQGTAIAA